jgi:hypothetical protein
MSLTIQRYVHTPLYVNAVQVTPDNMQQVANWCGGQILNQPADNRPYILVEVVRPLKSRQGQAFAGDWVLETAVGWKVYFDKAFKRDYMPALMSNDITLEDNSESQSSDGLPSVSNEGNVPVGAEA